MDHFTDSHLCIGVIARAMGSEEMCPFFYTLSLCYMQGDCEVIRTKGRYGIDIKLYTES